MNPRRVGAAAVATSLSVLGTLGLGRAIDEGTADSTAAPSQTSTVAKDRAASGRRGPTSLLVIRRSHPVVVLHAPVPPSAGTSIQVSQPAPAAPAQPAPQPQQPTTRSS